MSELQPKSSLNQKRVTDFITNLNRLDRGELSRLKRCAGKSLEETHRAIGLFYRLLPYPTPSREDEPLFWLVATHFPLVKNGGKGNFGAALRKVRSEENKNGLDRRLEALLDADGTRLIYRLSQAVRFLHTNAKDIQMNWAGLLLDLLQWQHPDHYVQKAWAKAYFAMSSRTVEQLIQNEVSKLEEQENQ